MPRRIRKPHEPQQERSRFLADAVLEAAERVVQEVGWSRAKVSRIAKVAGVSIGSLYRYFPGRDVLLAAIIDRSLQSDVDVFDAALQQARGDTPAQTLEAFAEAMLAGKQITHPKLLRHLVDTLEAAGRLETVQRTFDDMAHRFAAHLFALHPELGPLSALERRCHIAFWGIRAGLIARVRVEDPFDLDAFREDALRMSCAMLRG